MVKCRVPSKFRQFWDSNLGPLDSKAKTIPLHKRVWPESAEESPPPLHSSPFWREETWVGWFHLPQCCGLYTILFHSKQACIYTTEDTIVCDEICIHTTFHTSYWMDFFSTSSSPMKCRVPSKFRQFWDSNLGPLDSKAKTIPLHKRVWPESAEESPPPLQYHYRHINYNVFFNIVMGSMVLFTPSIY